MAVCHECVHNSTLNPHPLITHMQRVRTVQTLSLLVAILAGAWIDEVQGEQAPPPKAAAATAAIETAEML